ncbi:hypothetical protein DFH29DRAFT_999464 [Suillus ampliporus]|nr:hypothetical protein DFH29DRAFT_999464 [Suillus ampliporus]
MLYTPHTITNFANSEAESLLIDSDTTLVAHDDGSIKDFSDDTSDDIKHSEWFGGESSFCEADFSDSLLPGTETLTPDDSESDPSHSACPVDALMTTACTLGSTPTLSTTPRLDSIEHGAANRLMHYPPTALRHQKSHLGKQKYEPRASRLIAARDSIAHSNLRQIAIHYHDWWPVDYLEQVYDNNILFDQAALIDGWAVAMTELGLTSMLSPGPSESLLNQKTIRNLG